MTTAKSVVHVVGARPNFVKAAPVMRALASSAAVSQCLIHTGQHYDRALSAVFFEQLGLPEPTINLEVGSDSFDRQMATLLPSLADAYSQLQPGMVVVYGDVTSTLAAALVASYIGLPIAHVEAGLRSFDMTMPEERNRRMVDVLSAVLFATTEEAAANLEREAVAGDVHFVGNPMIDSLFAALPRADAASMRTALGLPDRYVVGTIHRQANVDDDASARAVFGALADVAREVALVLPLHPRGRRAIERLGLDLPPELRVVEPLGYVEFLSLLRSAALVITDSGGVQEETTILGVPCLTMRPNTERPITIEQGTNALVSPHELLGAVRHRLAAAKAEPMAAPALWDGHAGERIAAVIEARLA